MLVCFTSQCVYIGVFIGEQNRWLAYPHEGCGLAVFDTGAYCSSMASNYNMRVISARRSCN